MSTLEKIVAKVSPSCRKATEKAKECSDSHKLNMEKLREALDEAEAQERVRGKRADARG